jgi:hypothetical protein
MLTFYHFAKAGEESLRAKAMELTMQIKTLQASCFVSVIF